MFVPEVGINTLSKVAFMAPFNDSGVMASPFNSVKGMCLPFNSSFSPLIKSALSLSPSSASRNITLALVNLRVKCSYTSEYR